MIHVDIKPEPMSFDANVRQPGNTFLSKCITPNALDWKHNRFWNKCSGDLYWAYNGICAYTGQWFSQSTSNVSVDHFYPKSVYPEKAYEWDNYRLTTQVMNNNKGDKIVLDPFEILDGDLVLDFPSCLVKPKGDISPALKGKALSTIKILKLNEETQASQRADILMEYISDSVSFPFLQRRYPFIAKELMRQGLIKDIKEIFKIIS